MIIENNLVDTPKPLKSTFDNNGGRNKIRVKIKSLAEESKIIRKEEKIAKSGRSSLREHRVGIVRYEARHAQLAYAFLLGRPYEMVEQNARIEPDINRLVSLVSKYGNVFTRNGAVWITNGDTGSILADAISKWLK